MFYQNSMRKYYTFFLIPFILKFAALALLVLPMTANAQSTPPSFADLAEKLLPTVVNISSTQAVEEQPQMRRNMPFPQDFPMFPEGHPFNDMFEDFFGGPIVPNMPQQRLPAASMGSGFIIDKENGIIITNNHVVKDADDIKITLHNDAIIPAEIIGKDDKTDIAVLKADLSDQNVTEAVFGESDNMRVGDWVLAIGNPFGLGGTVTAGIISARQRDIQSGPYDDYLQTDASINRGNSGGPMFNLNGEVIGINTAIFSPTGGSVGIGFAIPSALAQPVIAQLKEYGRTRRGWLGVRIQTVTEDIADSLGLAKPAGALVADITKTGPAEEAGIKAGDIILAFNNKPVREMRNLPRLVAESEIGSSVPVVVWRDGKRVNVSVTLGELEKAEESGILADNNAPDQNSQSPESGTMIDRLGLTVTPLTDALREEYGISANLDGLLITEIDINSDAAKKGITEGDVITDINQKSVGSVDALTKEIETSKASGRDAVLLLINSRGSIQFVAVKITKDDKEE
jgi:serine protease Do